MNGSILVFGAAGQLGHEVLALAGARDIEATGCNRAEADITDFASVRAAILAVNPRLVLNAAAYTAVDRAETEPEAAYAANAVGAETIARAAALWQVPVIQISTDYVFDGTKKGAYVETDPIAPLGVYGKTKAAGETMVRQVHPRHFILRTSCSTAASCLVPALLPHMHLMTGLPAMSATAISFASLMNAVPSLRHV
jgi:dTDP-4-dehydrorhamnose reductase